MSEEEKQGKTFQVKDKRRFTEEGDQRQDVTEEKAQREQAAGAVEDKASSAKAGADAEKGPKQKDQETEKKPPADLPEIDFSTFVVSLSSSVLIHLGVVPDPMTNETRRELPLAKQTIDILGMMQEKTRGNLSKEEGQLMESLLYDLRMRYVEESKKG